jgi:serine/threonine protein kinase
VLAGKYVVERLLGVGGMGAVLAARHVDLDERVAIKMLLPGVTPQGEPVARFIREARAAIKIRSDHVVRILDVARLDDGSPYIVMEYLDGCDLSRLIDEGGPLPVDDAIEYVVQACEAIASAHAMGIVHRDLKPANLFLVRTGDGGAHQHHDDHGHAVLHVARAASLHARRRRARRHLVDRRHPARAARRLATLRWRVERRCLGEDHPRRADPHP